MNQYLTISREKFMEGYNYDVSPFLLRHNYKESKQKGGRKKQIFYISWSNVLVLLKQIHPTFLVDFEKDKSGNVIHYQEELDRMFIYPYLIDTESGTRSPSVPYSIVDANHYEIGVERLQELSQKINTPLLKVIDRAMVRCVAVVTGIGLSLWTGEDVTGQDRRQITENVQKLNRLYHLIFDKSFYDLSKINTLSLNELLKIEEDLELVFENHTSTSLGYISKILGYDKQYQDKNQKSYIVEKLGAIPHLLKLNTQELLDFGKEISSIIGESK